MVKNPRTRLSSKQETRLDSRQAERYRGLSADVLRLRNLARELLDSLPEDDSVLRARLGHLAYVNLESHYETKESLPKSLSAKVRQFNRRLLTFTVKYDNINRPDRPASGPAEIEGLSKVYKDLDKLHQEVSSQIVRILNPKDSD